MMMITYDASLHQAAARAKASRLLHHERDKFQKLEGAQRVHSYICQVNFRGHMTLATPPFRNSCKNPDCHWEHAHRI